VFFVGLAAAGMLTLARRRPAIAALAISTIAISPPALALASAIGLSSDRLAPRHLIFLLPFWLALVATGVTRLTASLPLQARVAAAVAIVAAAALAPSAVFEPRTMTTGTERAVAAPATWLTSELAPTDLLYPYSPVCLAALPVAKEARAYSREPVALARAVKRTGATHAIFVSIPLREPVNGERLRRTGLRFRTFPSWLILESQGPFRDGTAALGSAVAMLGAAAPLISEPLARAYLDQIRGAACIALRQPC
jgi:hypothetical protein